MRVGLLGMACMFALSACASHAALPDEASNASSDELAVAQTVARDALRNQDADISSATFVVHDGTVAPSQSNVGPPCPSGRLIVVKLIGTFPHITTTGHPVQPGEHPDFTVTALNVTADAASGQACLSGVQTGAVEPEDGAIVLPLD